MGSKLQVANRLASATGAPKFTVTITKIWVYLARFSPAKPGSNRQVAYNTVSTHQKADQKRVFCGLDLRQMRRKSLPHAAGGQCAE